MKHEKIANNSGTQLTADSGLSRSYEVACKFHFTDRIYQKSSFVEAKAQRKQK